MTKSDARHAVGHVGVSGDGDAGRRHQLRVGCKNNQRKPERWQKRRRWEVARTGEKWFPHAVHRMAAAVGACATATINRPVEKQHAVPGHQPHFARALQCERFRARAVLARMERHRTRKVMFYHLALTQLGTRTRSERLEHQQRLGERGSPVLPGCMQES